MRTLLAFTYLVFFVSAASADQSQIRSIQVPAEKIKVDFTGKLKDGALEKARKAALAALEASARTPGHPTNEEMKKLTQEYILSFAPKEDYIWTLRIEQKSPDVSHVSVTLDSKPSDESIASLQDKVRFAAANEASVTVAHFPSLMKKLPEGYKIENLIQEDKRTLAERLAQQLADLNAQIEKLQAQAKESEAKLSELSAKPASSRVLAQEGRPASIGTGAR